MQKLVWLFLLILCAPPALAQSLEGDWEYVQMTAEGKVDKFEGSGRPWLELKGGTWSLMLSGRLSGGGPYVSQGRKLIMKYEDGSLYGDFEAVLKEPYLELTGVGETRGFDLKMQRVK